MGRNFIQILPLHFLPYQLQYLMIEYAKYMKIHDFSPKLLLKRMVKK